MRKTIALPLLALASLGLQGCVASMAASAVALAARSAQPKPVSNEGLKPQAEAACTERASQFGTVHVIDIEQRSIDRMTVWGTVDDGKQRQSFECGFGTKITGFKLRPIPPR